MSNALVIRALGGGGQNEARAISEGTMASLCENLFKVLPSHKFKKFCKTQRGRKHKTTSKNIIKIFKLQRKGDKGETYKTQFKRHIIHWNLDLNSNKL